MTFTRLAKSVWLLPLGLAVLCAAGPVAASPLQRWHVSCGTDPGALKKSGRTYTFRTSTNKCPGGFWKQRSEIATDHMGTRQKGTFLFSTHLSITTPSRQKLGIFQIHDKRHGCAPPLKLDLLPSGQLTFDSEYKIGTAPGNNCRKVATMMGQRSAIRLKRDGTEYKLGVLVDFDGNGGFRVWASVNDRQQIAGLYRPPAEGNFYRSPAFYFKHGSYSLEMFPYTIVSRNMTVKRVKIGN